MNLNGILKYHKDNGHQWEGQTLPAVSEILRIKIFCCLVDDQSAATNSVTRL